MPLFLASGRLIHFAHVPRTAGAAIEAHLRRRFGVLGFLDPTHHRRAPEDRWTRTSPQHVDRATFARLVPPALVHASFATVRHPARRLRSAFLFHKHVERTIPEGRGFLSWLEEVAGGRNHERYDNHGRSMNDLVPEGATVFRLEEGLDPLVAWLDAIAGEPGPREVERRNALAQRAPAIATAEAEVGPAERALIEDAFAVDYARFGYPLGPEAGEGFGEALDEAAGEGPEGGSGTGSSPAAVEPAAARGPSGAHVPAARPGQRRVVLLHHHLFKNAGTSVDRLLRRSFGDRWVSREFATGTGDNGAEVARWIEATPAAVAFSTHTGLGPLPPLEGVEVLTLLLLRDPVERIRSAYQFERRQQADTLGARLAKETDLEGYVRARLARPGDRQCRNFQTHRLASFAPGPGPEIERATRALEGIAVLGLVERFDEAMERLARALAPHHPGFRPESVAANRSEAVLEVGPDLLRVLEEQNADDRELLARARRRLSA